MSPSTRGDSKRPRSCSRASMSMRAELVAHHLEVARGGVDLQIADAQLVRAEAAVDVERAARGVFDVQRVEGDAVARPAQRRAAVLVARPVVLTRNAALARSTVPSKCGSLAACRSP